MHLSRFTADFNTHISLSSQSNLEMSKFARLQDWYTQLPDSAVFVILHHTVASSMMQAAARQVCGAKVAAFA